MIPGALERVLSLSRADQCMALGWETSRANVRWASNTSTTNGITRSRRLFVISVIDGRVGSVGVTHVTDDGLEDVVRRSEAAARGMTEAEDVRPLIPGDGTPPDWDDPATHTDVGVFASLAPAIGQAFTRAEADGIKLFGYAEHTSVTGWLATSAGVRRRHTQQEGRLEINAKSPDFARSAWVGSATEAFEGVDVAALYERLAQRLAWSETVIEAPAGRYQVVLEPSAVADMLCWLYWATSARDAADGRSVFSRPGGGTRIGEAVYPAFVNLHSDPYEPGLEVEPFVMTSSSGPHSSVFDNGLPAQRTQWVEDGVLRALISTRHLAATSDTPLTPYIDNLVLESTGEGSVDDLVESTTGRALLVTCFWYIRDVDPQTLLVTGLTRDGVFLVEDGKVKGAVNNFRFNMSPVEMLNQIVEMGRTERTLPREFGDYFHSIRTPPLRIDRFNMSSVSEAT